MAARVEANGRVKRRKRTFARYFAFTLVEFAIIIGAWQVLTDLGDLAFGKNIALRIVGFALLFCVAALAMLIFYDPVFDGGV